MEVLLTYWLSSPIGSYNVVGLAVLSIILAMGFYYLIKTLFVRAGRKFYVLIIMLFFIAQLVSGYVNYIHKPVWGNPGRNDDEHIKSYQNLSQFIQRANISQNVIILGQSTLFKYYCERNLFWINDVDGVKIPFILKTKDKTSALKWIGYYGVKYVFIDNDQTYRRGLGDYFSSDGLLSYIDEVNYYKKIYDDGTLRLYEVKLDKQ